MGLIRSWELYTSLSVLSEDQAKLMAVYLFQFSTDSYHECIE